MRRRVRFRPPGVKPGQRVGPLGPFRGRLGLHWVIAPLLLGLVLAAAGWLFLRGSPPGPPWRPVGSVEDLRDGEPREAGSGVFVAPAPGGGFAAVIAEPGCPLSVADDGYADCRGRRYRTDGSPEAGLGEPLDLVPLRVSGGEIYVNPAARIER